MSVKITDLHCKEVICVNDGRRLGFISDVCIEIPEGKVLSIIVPGRGKIFGLLGSKEDYVIPWGCIKRIGPDIVLVDIQPENCRIPKPRFHFPF